MLSVKVGDKSVKLFENTESGVNVMTDDVLENFVKVVKKSGADKSAVFKQAKDYVRAVGRIMLHSMAHKYILPAKAMSPFYMTGEEYFDFIIITNLFVLIPHFPKCVDVLHRRSNISWIQ
jgi:hypothetical protein